MHDILQELYAVQQMEAGLISAVRGDYRSVQAEDPILNRINKVCETVQQEIVKRDRASSLINPSPSRSPETNQRKSELAQELDSLIHELAAPASLVAEVLRIYGASPSSDGKNATRGFIDTASVTPPIAEVRTFQQVASNRVASFITIPTGSPVADQLQSWTELLEQLQDLYSGMEELATSQAFVLNELNSEVVDALLADGPVDEEWDGEVLEEALTMHDLRTGEVQVLKLTGLEVDGFDWIVHFAETTKPLPLLSRGEILRLVTIDGRVTDEVPHRDLEFREGTLLVLGVEPEYLKWVSGLSVQDVQQLALLHYGHTFQV